MKTKLPISTAPPHVYEGRLAIALQQNFEHIDTHLDQIRLNRLAAFNSALSAPTGGTWAVGDKVWNSVPAEAGAGGSKYVIIGWICTVSGTPGTWLQMRTLTGN